MDHSQHQFEKHRTITGKRADDVIDARTDGEVANQIHLFASLGNDQINLDMHTSKARHISHGHHAFSGLGFDTFNFTGLKDLKGTIVGRLDDFSNGTDRITIEGRELDLTRPEQFKGYKVSIISMLNPSSPVMSDEQQWLRIETAKGQILYALEGARYLPGMTDREEAHFLKWNAVLPETFVPTRFEDSVDTVRREHMKLDSKVLNTATGHDDMIHGSGGRDLWATGRGNDTVHALGGDDFIFADFGEDLVYGGAGNDTLDGGKGHDTIYGGDGNDAIYGGVGNDLLRAGNGNDTVYGGTGDDRLYGNAGHDYIHAGKGHDLVYGGFGHDRLFGMSGNDRIFGEGGDDQIHGGDGNDWLAGNTGSDTLLGGTGNDTLYGGDGNDSLSGGAGHDVLRGDAGNDRLNGNAGNDVLFGGVGRDTLSGDDGADRLSGEAGDDLLSGGAGRDTLSGGQGNDRLAGGADHDWLSGDGGNDTLLGDGGNDTLRGGSGNDRLIGGLGRDDLGGGAGADTFVFRSIAEAGIGANRDMIRDFYRGVDKVDLSGIDANVKVAGDQAFAFSKKAAAFSVWYEKGEGLAGTLKGDVDGDKVADFEIHLYSHRLSGDAILQGDFIF